MPSTPATAPTSIARQDLELLERLRHHRRGHRERSAGVALGHPWVEPPSSLGQRIADRVATTVGSWRFILVQSGLITGWILWNLTQGTAAWDPYPFILLNLLLSFQAAYTAPAIMMSQNRQAQIDRKHAEGDYEVNVKAELEIELLHEKIDLLREQELRTLTEVMERLIQRLEGPPSDKNTEKGDRP